MWQKEQKGLTEDCFSCNTRKSVQLKWLYFDSDFTTITVWWTLQSSEHQHTRHRNSFFPQAIHLMNTWH